MTIPTAVYTANRGYAWSNIPPGMTIEKLDLFLRMIDVERGNFPDPLSMTIGFVSDSDSTAIFSIQNVENWDNENRAADYGAFAFFDNGDATKIDFVEMLNRDFFWLPSKTPITELEYCGAVSAEVLPHVPIILKNTQRCPMNARAVGNLIAQYGANSQSWIGILNDESMIVKCGEWK